MDNKTNKDECSAHRALTTGAAARIIGCSECKIRRMLRRGELSGSKLGGRWVVHPADVERITGISFPGDADE